MVAGRELTGRVPHALMQWAAVASPASGAATWDEGDVRVGNLAPAALAALIDVLAPFTGEQDCFHALWEGWGWVDGRGVRIFSVSDDGRVEPARVPEPGVSAEVRALPRLRLPDRDHLLFRGPLRAALDMGWHESPLGFEPQSTPACCAGRRSWCVGAEIDFDSTLVGGSRGLIAAVLARRILGPRWPVQPRRLTTSGASARP
ncbi:hypothetical protein GCM10020219_020280 [Nonomuraea dietziae]